MTDSVAVFPPGFRLTDTLGVPYNGASIEFYDSGTTNGRLVYSDQALTISLGTIVYGDSAGYPVSASGGTNKVLVYTNTADYKVIIKDGSGATIATHDAIKGAVISSGVAGAAATITQAQADARYIRNVNALVAVSNIDDVDLMPFWDIATSTNQGISYSDYKTDIGTDLLIAWRAAGHIFATGAVVAVVFRQSAAPTGWTKIVSSNDRALRVVNGALADGGSSAFSAAFPSQTPTGTVGGTTLAVVDLATHSHTTPRRDGVGETGGNAGPILGAPAAATATTTVSTNGSNSAHTHAFTGNALAAFSPTYADVIFASKN